MKAYKITLLVLDFDGLGADGIKDEIEHIRYPNDCINPRVIKIHQADIGEWHDDHPFK